MDKYALKKAMMELAEEQMLQADHEYKELLSTARLDQEEAHVIDDHAQAVIAAELADAFNDQVHEYEHKLEALKEIDFGDKNTVSAGAVVELGKRHLVIAVSTAEFEFEGKSFIGISAAAPIFAALNGRSSGESFEFNGKELKIGTVC